MKILLICSKRFYDRIPPIETELKSAGHILTMPNCYDAPDTEEKHRAMGEIAHSKWKAEMINHSFETIKNNDAVLVLNFDKGEMKNYVGGATFLEMYDAFRLGKKIFMYNKPPEGILHDEITGFEPNILNGDLSTVI